MEDVPWEIRTPPQDLRDLLMDHSILQGGQVLDVACGTGNCARFLASRGFRVTAVDFSRRALEIARSQAVDSAHSIEYVDGDATAFGCSSCQSKVRPDSRL